MGLQRIATGKPLERNFRHSAGVVSAGRLLHTSGIVSRDAAGDPVGPGDMRTQIVQVFENLRDVMDAAGTDFSRAVRITIYVTDMAAYQKTRSVADEYFVAKPAVTLFEVSRLADPAMLIEIDAVAEVD